MQGDHVKQLTPLELAAWRGFLRVHAGLVRELDRELDAAHALPLTHYEVLLYLEAAPGHRLRMSELAASVLLSQSGVTRLVDRLERDGLVVREPCPEDRRGLLARLTDEGLRRLAAARPTHLAGIRARFLASLSEDDLRSLAATWERLSPGATS
jgi:DNA-binding MarR family transcriptional regulator